MKKKATTKKRSDGVGFRYMKLGDVASVLSPSEHPEPLKCIFHQLVPLACITADPDDAERARQPGELAIITQLADHLKESEQLLPCRLVRIKPRHVDPDFYTPDRDGQLYCVVSGLRIVLASIQTGRSHVRAEVLPDGATAWPASFNDDPDKCCEYESRLASLYFGSLAAEQPQKDSP